MREQIHPPKVGIIGGSMPIIKSAKKKLRADLRKRGVNLQVKRQVKSTLKKFAAVPSADNLTQAYSILDVAAKKNVIPKKRASRTKNRLASRARVSVGKRKTKAPKNSSQKA